MAVTDFYMMQAEVMAAKNQPGKPPKKRTKYLVAAWNRHHGYWRVLRDTGNEEFPTVEEAEKFAGNLSHHWSNATIIKVDLPGEEVTT